MNKSIKQNADAPSDEILVEYPETPSSHRDYKRVVRKTFVFISLILLLVLIGGFLWLGGYVNDWMCSSVQKDSVLWNKFSCGGVSFVVDKDQEYSYEEKDVKNLMVTDLETVVTKVVSESSDAVVGIGVSGGNMAADQIVGSGFVVSSSGLIVTNQHVVSGADASNFYVVVDGLNEPFKVEKIYRDEVNDLALIKIDKENLKVVPLGDSSNLKVGQTAIAIGNPLGSLSNTVTVGSISALNREVEVSGDMFRFSSRTHFDVIQTDAAINPGNSGGPLINSNGEVIGVNFATISGADNLSFAIPINLVKERIQELNEYGNFRLPFVGVEYQRRLIFFRNEGIIGAIVVNVVPGSPAQEAGIGPGDIIVQFNGKDLEDDSLLNLIQRSKIGEEVDVVIIRGGESITVKLTVGDRNDY